MIEIKYIKLKPLSWFKENCYYDDETSMENTYYWINHDAYVDWMDATEDTNFSPAMTINDVRRGYTKWVSNYGSTFEEYSWGMDYELTIELYPELYI